MSNRKQPVTAITTSHVLPLQVRELFEEISEITCVDLALCLDSLDAVVDVAEAGDREVTLHHWYPVLEIIRRHLQETKNKLEGLSNVQKLVTK